VSSRCCTQRPAKADWTLFSGFLNIDKPLGMTSHDVVNLVRRALRPVDSNLKVGHAGTLDPLASGVLVLCVGAATRLSDFVMRTTKEYRATVGFGVVTDTYDGEGQVVRTHPADHLTKEAVQRALEAFIGHIRQVPPAYSAIKKDGRKLYELARKGEALQLEPREVYIERIEVVSMNGTEAVLDVTCGSGTYIRSLAYDLGEMLGVGAHLAGLVRTRSGAFHLSDAIKLQGLTAHMLPEILVPPVRALTHLRHIWLTADEVRDLSHGRAVPWRPALGGGATSDTIVGFGPGDVVVALLKEEDQLLKPVKVFHV